MGPNPIWKKGRKKVKLLSRVQLFATPWTIALPGSSVRGILQARVLEWAAISFSRGSSQPSDRTRVSRVAGRCFTLQATREANPIWLMSLQKGKFWTQKQTLGMWEHRGTTTLRSSRGLTIRTPRREAWNRCLHYGPRRKPPLPAPWSHTSSLQNHEKINFYCLSHPVYYFVLEALANQYKKKRGVTLLFVLLLILTNILITWRPWHLGLLLWFLNQYRKNENDKSVKLN